VIRTLLIWVAILPAICGALESDQDEPITIESDQAELDQIAQVGTYSGNVVVSQGSFTLNADTMVVTVEDGALSHIVAKGDPTDFKQRPEGQTEDVKGGANQIDFFADRSLIVLTGEAWVRQGKDMVQSPKIEYEVKTDRVRAVGTGDGEGGGRVRMIFHPGGRDE
jgi:lipopolysaccharide export system protein LptA